MKVFWQLGLVIFLFTGKLNAQFLQLFVHDLTELEELVCYGSQKSAIIVFDFKDLDLGNLNLEQFVNVSFWDDLDPQYLQRFKGLKNLWIKGKLTEPLRADYFPSSLEFLSLNSSRAIKIDAVPGDLKLSLKELTIEKRRNMTLLSLFEDVGTLHVPADLSQEEMAVISGYEGLKTLKLNGDLSNDALENIHQIGNLEALVLIGVEEVDSVIISYLSVLPVQWIAFHYCEAEDQFIITGFPQLKGISFDYCRFDGVFVYQAGLRNLIFEDTRIPMMSITSQTDSLAIIVENGNIEFSMSNQELRAIWALLANKRTAIYGLEGQFLPNLKYVDLSNPAGVLFDINKIKCFNEFTMRWESNFKEYSYGDRIIDVSIDGWIWNDFVLDIFIFGSKELATSLSPN